jgi:Sulfotransferase family
MRDIKKLKSIATVLERYSDNPLREALYLTRNSSPWRVQTQLAYISVRRVLFAIQRRPVPVLTTDVLVSCRHQAIFVAIPKAGSRSLLAAFIDRWSEAEGVKRETTSLGALLDRDLSDGDYRILAVVRNPWDRAYSCYRDKIARLDRARVRAHLIARYRDLRPFMPFDAFVEWLGSDEGADVYADRHWASQSAFLRVGRDFRCEHFFKLEQLTEQMDRLRCVLDEPSFYIPRTNTLSDPSTRHDVYNSHTRTIIARRYEEDIDRFQYVF